MRILPFVLMAGCLPLAAAAPEPTKEEIEKVITNFAAKESEFAKARETYTYRQTIKIQEFEGGGQARGRFDLVSDIIFSPEGKRTERIVRAPSPSLVLVSLSPEDEQDLRSVQPFVLTTKDLPKYQVDYLSKEKLDEIDCYVFAVKPRKMSLNELPNFLPMSPSCLSKPDAAEEALPIAWGTSEVVLMFTVRS